MLPKLWTFFAQKEMDDRFQNVKEIQNHVSRVLQVEITSAK